MLLKFDGNRIQVGVGEGSVLWVITKSKAKKLGKGKEEEENETKFRRKLQRETLTLTTITTATSARNWRRGASITATCRWWEWLIGASTCNLKPTLTQNLRFSLTVHDVNPSPLITTWILPISLLHETSPLFSFSFFFTYFPFLGFSFPPFQSLISTLFSSLTFFPNWVV